MKTKTNNKQNSYNQLAVVAISKKHGFTTRFIRQCLNNERDSITADTIRKEYKKLTIENERKINQYLENEK